MPTDMEYLQTVVGELQSKGVTSEEGLSDDEVHQVERNYELKFPPDLRAFLQFAIPVSESFPN